MNDVDDVTVTTDAWVWVSVQSSSSAASRSIFQVLARSLKPEFRTMIAACPRGLAPEDELGQQEREL